MSWSEHPVAQKIIAGIVIAGATAVGGLSLTTRDKVLEHDAKINSIIQIQQDLSTIKDTTAAIKTDVAVLKDRTDRENEAKRAAEPFR